MQWAMTVQYPITENVKFRSHSEELRPALSQQGENSFDSAGDPLNQSKDIFLINNVMIYQSAITWSGC